MPQVTPYVVSLSFKCEVENIIIIKVDNCKINKLTIKMYLL